MTALMVAASEGQPEGINVIAQREKEPNRRDTSGRTALHYACFGGMAKNAEAILKIPGV